MTTVTILEIMGSEGESAWDHYVTGNPRATGYHLIGWRSVIEKTFGHRTFYYRAIDSDGAVQGVLPLVYVQSVLFGRFLVSLPYLNYGGVVSETPEVAAQLVAQARYHADELGAGHVELRHTGDADLDWPKKDHKVSMRLDLPEQYDDLMKAFSPKLRAQVRRGEKEGMTTEIGGQHLLGDFYEVFARNMRDLGTPVYGKRFFAEILRTFPKDAKICAVKFEGKPVAAGFIYGFRNMLEIPWASSDRRYAMFAPNMLLYSSVLRYACEQGYRVFDFGRSTKDSGTYRFKKQWGARPVQLVWHYWIRDSQKLPELNPQNPKFRLAIEIWKRLPIPITTVLGPQISKSLP